MKSLPAIEWNSALIQKYNYSGPRYTSYPTALEFSQDYDDVAFATAAVRYPTRPLSLYGHISFCHKLCYFCGCNKIVTRHGAKVDDYLDTLARKIRARVPFCSPVGASAKCIGVAGRRPFCRWRRQRG